MTEDHPIDQRRRTVLVTGATGFLGGEIVRELLETTDARLLCLVRADSHSHAARRGAEVTRSPRVTWLRADLTEADLGLDPATWAALAATIDEIVHCAASTRFDLSLAEADRINTGATGRLLGLAKAAGPRFRRFHHVSTAYASGCAAPGPSVTPDHLPGDRARHFRNTYERTKARAERLLRAQTRVPITIHRPSIITGHSRTGATTNWNVIYEPMRQLARGALPMVPAGGRAILDLVAVDHVARGLVALAAEARRGHHSHHLTAAPTNAPLDVGRFVTIIEERLDVAGIERAPCRVVSSDHWRALSTVARAAGRLPRGLAATSDARRRALVVTRRLQRFAPFEPYTRVDVAFDNRADATVLASRGIVMPPAAAYTARLVDFALANGFGRTGADPAVEETASHEAASIVRVAS